MIIGISTDQLKDQEEFTEQNKLTFPLYADTELKAVKAFGVPTLAPNIASRRTYVIDKKGVVRKIYDVKGNPSAHPDEVLEFVKKNLAKS